MTWSLVLVWAVCVLQIGAGVAYAVQGQWKLGCVWGFVGIANVFMALLDKAK